MSDLFRRLARKARAILGLGVIGAVARGLPGLVLGVGGVGTAALVAVAKKAGRRELESTREEVAELGAPLDRYS